MRISVNEKELREYFEGLTQIMKQVVKESFSGDEQQASRLIQVLRTAIREEMWNDSAPAHSGHGGSVSPLKQPIERYVHRQVELTSFGGTIQGTVTEVGEDYAEISEPDGTAVLVHLNQVISFQTQ
ncbi:hypothetical protein [Paenibacillus apiarius]|uniref:DUF2642 domain-containing protein n=1 Tax=Paenibacillus apiarius TaxID=46240 RepID=A0ABT4DY94_9BACL|nr:hypothetical protein [Paenibacillus apiarius]MBN3526996.1 hypothetical protein [Paenibacillus apiarius]MCY9514867.1 hypothetical protein [Paenibacillus apiarius]MCY9521253.1 hypothetical protein [Paenibacillus apiarius]MCY9553969.1 hypothetical protein [Paenibacillus apiarius]MCY9560343.1 hypothetical protein [Paenibacillus apiarius]